MVGLSHSAPHEALVEINGTIALLLVEGLFLRGPPRRGGLRTPRRRARVLPKRRRAPLVAGPHDVRLRAQRQIACGDLLALLGGHNVDAPELAEGA
eukprot:2285991-Lingulodinium_polyedra.AAC.1